jgi:predicted 2-oxoglutarate/Fe(II)-dependent dioxygenase YbiX
MDCPWFCKWSAYSDIRFNRYKKNRLMAPHCDHISTLFDGTRKGVPILTILLCFNDNYSGGEFIMFEDTEIKMKQGDIMIFPSNFLYPHTVKEVTDGIRYSGVSWAW